MFYGYEHGKVYGFDEKADRTEWVRSNLHARYSLSFEVARNIAIKNQGGRVYDYYDGSVVKEF